MQHFYRKEDVQQYEKELEARIKEMMAQNIWPDSAFWWIAKVAAIKDIGGKYGLPFRFGRELFISDMLTKIPLFRNHRFLQFMSWLYNLRRTFKRYHKLDGLKFYIRTNKDSYAKMNDIVRNYQCLTEYEPETTKIVKDAVRPGDVCVDIGASIGYFTNQFARATGPSGKVFAIEPTDFQQEYLRRNIRANGHEGIVRQYAVGAWDKDEVVRQPRNAPAFVQTELRCRPVDDILEENGVMKVDFMKIDTDGAEPWVLRGLLRTIQRSPNLKMIIEYYPKYVKDAGGQMSDIDEILKKYFNVTVIPGDYSGGCWNLFCVKKHNQ